MNKEILKAAAKEYARNEPHPYGAFIAGAEWLSKSQWIDVKDGLPEEDGRYLCVISQVNDLGISRFVWNCSYGKLHGWLDAMANVTVTHWQQLPSLPSLLIS